MSNLKELTKEAHMDAERQGFVKVLMSKNINPRFYATYLWNQHKKYDLLEAMAGAQGLMNELPHIRRKMKIEADFLELWSDDTPPELVASTQEYIMHMRTIMHDADKLMAHLYVLHMGDLSGGQMIAKRVPGKGTMYQFEGDTAALKEAIRSKTNDDMADEAQYVFTSATNLFKELMELDIEHYLEQTDTVSE
jgi:heme oxygenase